ncbi:hypothetical protein BC936DRAFT_148146 [Jimgerdemannia flammicorona]|uniref:Uncharacterized protein n=1 Tax=Jimgerdemannia flammicorona TaxID=994334 RepID=A0A433DL34_9FUNG|nr:hypothetical protein BC936DRAFT_148146 [Jimgerdemannia flammicorona]
MTVQVFDNYYLGITALVTILYQLSFFTVAASFKFDTVTDFAGGTSGFYCARCTDFGSGWGMGQHYSLLYNCAWIHLNEIHELDVPSRRSNMIL